MHEDDDAARDAASQPGLISFDDVNSIIAGMSSAPHNSDFHMSLL